METIHQLSIKEVRMLLLIWNISKEYKVRNLFCLDDLRKSRHVFKLGAWRTAKTCACLLRFSALNFQARVVIVTHVK